ncbi:alpha/beta hydrolase [Tamlana sp. 2_MG-2023]|uniref:alpha/beta fold hydrolase n=1 Tax=unclassified Tamlana TaxID=2614803 RepID=UPI0026E35520|nr:MULTISPECIES: alpha/beta hydrolase [unclassified Tamlana]MDO6758605.1 alpha/beta hydrolase [Tamlana sp. 2_MG-2023]MDO6789304.1 alpha/beta hydrolase [Tamlana sp. 1_MG-2023]
MTKLISKFIILFLCLGCASSKETGFNDYVFQNKKEKQTYLRAYNKALTLWQVPYTEDTIETAYGTAHVIISGPKGGKQMVLLHGMDASSTMWYPNIKALSESHRVYAIDFLMEPGKSTLTKDALTSEEIIIWYNSIFDHYQLKDFDLVAASRGGWIATLLAAQENQAINKMVLLSPAQTFEYIDDLRKTSNALFLKLFPSEKKFKKTLETFSSHPEKINSIYKKQFYLANKYAKTNSSMLQMKPFSDEQLKAITIPVLVLIGDEDVINSEESLAKANQLLFKDKTAVIEDAGHFLSIDQSESINKEITKFLK